MLLRACGRAVRSHRWSRLPVQCQHSLYSVRVPLVERQGKHILSHQEVLDTFFTCESLIRSVQPCFTGADQPTQQDLQVRSPGLGTPIVTTIVIRILHLQFVAECTMNAEGAVLAIGRFN